MRRRVLQLLQKWDEPVPPARLLRAIRATAVLEQTGTPDARRLLEALARGRRRPA